MSEEAKTEEGKGGIGAKDLSKWGMAFASVWIAAGSVLKWLNILNAETTDIILSGIAIVGIWSPTYLSIWLDKIKEIRLGK